MRMEKAKNIYFVASSVEVPVGDNFPSFYQRPCKNSEVFPRLLSILYTVLYSKIKRDIKCK